MKILVKNKSGEGPRRIALWVPLWLIKSRFICHLIANHAEVGMDGQDFHRCIREGYKALKAYVKANGHFNLVEVKSHDGTRVKIKI